MSRKALGGPRRLLIHSEESFHSFPSTEEAFLSAIARPSTATASQERTKPPVDPKRATTAPQKPEPEKGPRSSDSPTTRVARRDPSPKPQSDISFLKDSKGHGAIIPPTSFERDADLWIQKQAAPSPTTKPPLRKSTAIEAAQLQAAAAHGHSMEDGVQPIGETLYSVKKRVVSDTKLRESIDAELRASTKHFFIGQPNNNSATVARSPTPEIAKKTNLETHVSASSDSIPLLRHSSEPIRPSTAPGPKGLNLSKYVTSSYDASSAPSHSSASASFLTETQDVPASRIPTKYHVFASAPIRHQLGSPEEGQVFYNEEKKMWEKQVFPSNNPSGRMEAIFLAETLEKMLADLPNVPDFDFTSLAHKPPRQAVDSVRTFSWQTSFSTEFQMWDIVFAELVRQVHVHCLERGQTAERVRLRYLDFYQSLDSAFSATRLAYERRMKEMDKEREIAEKAWQERLEEAQQRIRDLELHAEELSNSLKKFTSLGVKFARSKLTANGDQKQDDNMFGEASKILTPEVYDIVSGLLSSCEDSADSLKNTLLFPKDSQQQESFSKIPRIQSLLHRLLPESILSFSDDLVCRVRALSNVMGEMVERRKVESECVAELLGETDSEHQLSGSSGQINPSSLANLSSLEYKLLSQQQIFQRETDKLSNYISDLRQFSMTQSQNFKSLLRILEKFTKSAAEKGFSVDLLPEESRFLSNLENGRMDTVYPGMDLLDETFANVQKSLKISNNNKKILAAKSSSGESQDSAGKSSLAADGGRPPKRGISSSGAFFMRTRLNSIGLEEEYEATNTGTQTDYQFSSSKTVINESGGDSRQPANRGVVGRSGSGSGGGRGSPDSTPERLTPPKASTRYQNPSSSSSSRRSMANGGGSPNSDDLRDLSSDESESAGTGENKNCLLDHLLKQAERGERRAAQNRANMEKYSESHNSKKIPKTLRSGQEFGQPERGESEATQRIAKSKLFPGEENEDLQEWNEEDAEFSEDFEDLDENTNSSKIFGRNFSDEDEDATSSSRISRGSPTRILKASGSAGGSRRPTASKNGAAVSGGSDMSAQLEDEEKILTRSTSLFFGKKRPPSSATIVARLTAKNERLKSIIGKIAQKKKPKPLSWLLKNIFTMYKAKIEADAFAETQGIKPATTPVFTFDWMKKTFGTDSLVDDYMGTLLSTLVDLKSKSLDAAIFLKFLSEEWNSTVLSVFLGALNQSETLINTGVSYPLPNLANSKEIVGPIYVCALRAEVITKNVFRENMDSIVRVMTAVRTKSMKATAADVRVGSTLPTDQSFKVSRIDFLTALCEEFVRLHPEHENPPSLPDNSDSDNTSSIFLRSATMNNLVKGVKSGDAERPGSSLSSRLSRSQSFSSQQPRGGGASSQLMETLNESMKAAPSSLPPPPTARPTSVEGTRPRTGSLRTSLSGVLAAGGGAGGAPGSPGTPTTRRSTSIKFALEVMDDGKG